MELAHPTEGFTVQRWKKKIFPVSCPNFYRDIKGTIIYLKIHLCEDGFFKLYYIFLDLRYQGSWMFDYFIYFASPEITFPLLDVFKISEIFLWICIYIYSHPDIIPCQSPPALINSVCMITKRTFSHRNGEFLRALSRWRFSGTTKLWIWPFFVLFQKILESWGSFWMIDEMRMFATYVQVWNRRILVLPLKWTRCWSIRIRIKFFSLEYIYFYSKRWMF